MTKKILLCTLAILLVLSTTSVAMLKVVDPETEAKYMEIAKSSAHGKVELLEGWVRDLASINKDIYIVHMIVDGKDLVVYIDMDTDDILSENEFNKYVDLDVEENKKNPTFSITGVKDTGDGSIEAEARATEDDPSSLKYIIPIVSVLVLGGCLSFINNNKRAKK
ncbi:hypothetical protein HYG86_03210 [Alkalicella caledoniensis]|uniref:PepSY domain-containing protein n=1 Tax=Alkalicella caledoniensis TaxID=2731377 RepID=A0A7G9W580_ALKCA|nr:hypothetical protein [Alkalicella caledoniensis]QNO13842.1 hypothetical protein HYG86_03210 [Alkalicella caledoniensis]